MELLQIDTIHVVARSPYFVLWSRLGNYSPNWLEELHAEGLLFEYWAHAACLIPIEQFPLFRSKMTSGVTGWRNSDIWRDDHKDLIEFVLTRIKEKGPTRSADFERKGSKKNGWWDWKEEKIALEFLWTHGELMIAYRNKFQRFYDLPDRVYPGYNQTSISLDEAILRSSGTQYPRFGCIPNEMDLRLLSFVKSGNCTNHQGACQSTKSHGY